RRGGTDDAVAEDLRDEHDDEQPADPYLIRADHAGVTAQRGHPQYQRTEQDGQRRDGREREQRDAEEATGHPFGGPAVTAVDVPDERRYEQRRAQRAGQG